MGPRRRNEDADDDNDGMGMMRKALPIWHRRMNRTRASCRNRPYCHLCHKFRNTSQVGYRDKKCVLVVCNKSK